MDYKDDSQIRSTDTDRAEKLPGLTSQEVQQRIDQGKVNIPEDSRNVTMKDIVKENVFTYFNLIFLIITICLCVVHSFRDLTFLPIIIFNTLIGIVQEWRSKSLLDRLSFVTQPKVLVFRDGEETEVPAQELVEDDLVILSAGQQIVADARVEEGGISVNESLLTGEADEIMKRPGDELLSGSYVVSGSCRAVLTHVGRESYVSRLTAEAKKRKNGEQSEMIRSLDRLVKTVGIIIIPIAALLFVQQYVIGSENLRDSVTTTVAAILGMIPEGLYLLASVAMAVSTMRLAMSKVLVHNMKSIETLARADVLCVDKTGTITENTMQVRRSVPIVRPNLLTGEVASDIQSGTGAAAAAGPQGAPDPAAGAMQDGDAASDGSWQNEIAEPVFTEEQLESYELKLGDFVACMSADNSTMQALKRYYSRQTGRRPEKVIPFSSVYKYSGAVFGAHQLVLGAPEFILRDQFICYQDQVNRYTMLGYRVLIFGEYEGTLDGGALTAPVRPEGMILLSNKVRETAPQTFRYFKEQGVGIKVISGDNPLTVSEVALEAGVEGAGRFIDASTLTDEDLMNMADEYVVFGRVTPQQKRVLVQALRKKGHTVAMTGDGVNDILALKEADCSIAMASGSDAAAHAAQMVLLESDFSRMPSVVAEGRRVVNNIERTASLFLVKNIFSLLMSVFSIIFMFSYPLQPSQISLISMFTIGIPAFVMSLEDNFSQIRGSFMGNVLYQALPAGLTDFIVISTLVVFCGVFGVSDTDLSTSCTILLAIVGLMILYHIASPMNQLHRILWLAMLCGLLFCMRFLRPIFSITSLSKRSAMLLVIFAIVTEPVLRYLRLLIRKIYDLGRYIMATIDRKREERDRLFSELQ